MSDEAYTQQTRYNFEVAGASIDITDVSDGYVCLEDAEKNGQEDTHCRGVLTHDGDQWRWDEGEGMFSTYMDDDVADGIVAYLNANGPPCLGNTSDRETTEDARPTMPTPDEICEVIHDLSEAVGRYMRADKGAKGLPALMELHAASGRVHLDIGTALGR